MLYNFTFPSQYTNFYVTKCISLKMWQCRTANTGKRATLLQLVTHFSKNVTVMLALLLREDMCPEEDV